MHSFERQLLSLFAVLAAMALSAPLSYAQPEPDAEEADAESDAEDEGTTEDADLDAEDEDPDEDPELDEPQLRAPQLEMPDVSVNDGASDTGEGEDTEGDSNLLEESDPDSRSSDDDQPSTDPTRFSATAPQSVLTLNGYHRVRGELQDTFFLGRDDAPFNLFVPANRFYVPAGGCRGSAEPMEDGGGVDRTNPNNCGGSDRLRFANTRLRLRPTLSLSDDVRVRMTIDVFDNLVLGSTPDGESYRLNPTTESGYQTAPRSPGVPIDSFTPTQNPPQGGVNNARDSIYVRHAWAEVTNRGLGQLRFGRMPSHWGLGILANEGMGIDADQSSDVDRIMGITKLGGFYLVAAWDFAAQGAQRETFAGYPDLRSVPFDATAADDINQYVFAAARRMSPEEQRDRLQRGSWVLNGGFYFVYRSQHLSSAGNADPFAPTSNDFFVRRDARAFIPDIWAQFLMGGLRLEVEAVAIAGSIQNIENDSFVRSDFKIRQFGFAFEGEYRLLDDKLSIRLYTGYASGDADVDGLSARAGLLAQRTDDRTVSHMQFHPNYRVDLILWRNIMQRVAGAWYLRPGISYDIIRSPFGRLFGAGVDVVYSRAAQEVQSYGSDPNLGLEIDFSVYYRSEDGPDPMDGFFMSFQYGVLFPFAGLGYVGGTAPADFNGLKNAQTLRLILGVDF